MKNIGFFICAVGNGHFSQAHTIFSILIKYGYKVPVVICFGKDKNKSWEKKLPGTDIYHELMPVSEENMNNYNNPISLYNIARAIFIPKNMEKYIQRYDLDMIISFWTPSVVTKLSIPWICMANQYTIDYVALNIINHLCKNNQIPVSIGESNRYSPYSLPSLIDTTPIRRENIKNNICVAYAVSGLDFQRCLAKIAINNPTFEIHFFLKAGSSIILPSNVHYHLTSRSEFRKYLEKTACVISTAGNELVQECVLNGIPIAIMPCSSVHFEQVSNISKYVIRLQYAIHMKPGLSLTELSKQNMIIAQKHIQQSIKNRDKDVINLVKQFI